MLIKDVSLDHSFVHLKLFVLICSTRLEKPTVTRTVPSTTLQQILCLHFYVYALLIKPHSFFCFEVVCQQCFHCTATGMTNTDTGLNHSPTLLLRTDIAGIGVSGQAEYWWFGRLFPSCHNLGKSAKTLWEYTAMKTKKRLQKTQKRTQRKQGKKFKIKKHRKCIAATSLSSHPITNFLHLKESKALFTMQSWGVATGFQGF